MKHSPISRREFARRCALSAAAVASSSIVSFASKAAAAPASGPAQFVHPFDQDWLFAGKFDPQLDESQFTKVTLPHCVVPLSWEGWEPSAWHALWAYRRHFTVPKNAEKRRVFIKFDGVMTGAKVACNGVEFPEHEGGYLPFQHELTQYLKEKDNVIDVVVDGRWQSVPPDGSPKGPRSVDYLEPAGITRSASLLVLPQVFISDVFAKPVRALHSDRYLDVTCTLNAVAPVTKPFQVRVELRDGAKVRHRGVGTAFQARTD
jgi:beta-galactosidase